ncbi:LacI family DNA-binding transcriptional regulator [Amycolatopsis vastitatis]|uniref:LacI family transcriptional regulator n=1 Tax=Amycolatopsis vastitatis TaxID=1905142 RepID=A0A229SQS6_9PSEU|nr:LacI family DNA-binding transcriptional regulator [Amycolatopsis vastitatis]OXM61110.1 LacI family transcriptional regulator [Amycolatopsis vastitatis]
MTAHRETARREPDRWTHMTLEDVAKAARVSPATASRVLNGSATVHAELAARVHEAATRLEYTPNAHAQALAGSSHRTVGVICHDISDPYFAAIARGVMQVAADEGMLVLLASTFRRFDREIEYVSMLRAQRAPAILLIGSGIEDRRWERRMAAELNPYLRGGGRVAVISRHRGLRVDSVLPENRAGAAALAAALAGMGHRRFAVLTGPRVLTTVADRLGGFRDGLAAAGVHLADEDVVEGAFDRDGGYAAMTRLIEAGLPATCVFAVTDVMAIGACAAIRDRGLSVPGDVSVAGFDDIPGVRDLTPPLTTVALPLERLGERALRLALDGKTGKRAQNIRMAGEVVIRASTATLPTTEGIAMTVRTSTSDTEVAS